MKPKSTRSPIGRLASSIPGMLFLAGCAPVKTTSCGNSAIQTAHHGVCCGHWTEARLVDEVGSPLIHPLGQWSRSPDGRWLVATQKTHRQSFSHVSKLIVADLTAGKVKTELSLKGEPSLIHGQWSPLGSQFLFQTKNEARTFVGLLSFRGEDVSLAPAFEKGNETTWLELGAWSPNGKWIALLVDRRLPGEAEGIMHLFRISIKDPREIHAVTEVQVPPFPQRITWQDEEPRSSPAY